MRLAVSTLSFRQLPLDEALSEMAKLEIDQVELCVDALHSQADRWRKSPEEILNLMQKLGMAINSIHIPLVEGGRRLSYDELLSVSLEKSQTAIDLARFLSADNVVQHVIWGDPSARGFDQILERLIPDLREVARYAEGQGIKLALENVPAKTGVVMLGTDPLEVMRAVAALASEAVGMCLDVSHCVAGGYNPVEVVQNLNTDKLFSLHLSDNLYDLREDRHLPIGAGQIAWEELFTQLKTRGFAGSLVVEVAGEAHGEKNLKDSLAYLDLHRGYLGISPG